MHVERSFDIELHVQKDYRCRSIYHPHLIRESALLPRRIPTSYHLVEGEGFVVNMPYLKPSSVLQYLLRTEPWILLGGLSPGAEAQQLLNTFWTAYKKDHPTHAIYTQGENLKFVIPITLHGDGGRTAKKQPLEIVSIHPILGLDTKEKAFKCSCDCPTWFSGTNLDDPCCIRLNSKHNSYLTHFLLCAFPSKKYKKLPNLLREMLDVIAQDLAAVCKDGLSLDGVEYKFAVLGMLGDMEYHCKIGVLTRSYHNIGHRNMIKVCHECHAGDPQFPFEDFTTGARWKTSMYVDVPWAAPPPFHHILYDGSWMSGRAASFFKRDPFHIFRLGVARNMLGSSIVLLAGDGFFDYGEESRSIEKRLERAWANFSLWCITQGERCSAIRSFSRDKLHYPNATSHPWVGCKGSDTIVIMKWLDWFVKLQLISNPESEALQKISKACCHGLRFQCIYRHGVFCRPHCRDQVVMSCKKFCGAYAELAHLSYVQGRTLFAMVPKAHAFDHIGHSLVLSREAGCDVCVNPGLWDCSMSEDFIGHVARQSRRVSYKHVVENTLLMYKIKTKSVIKKKIKKQRLQSWTVKLKRCFSEISFRKKTLVMCQYQDHSFRMVWFQPERSCLKRKVCVFEALALTKTMRSTMGWRMMDAVDVQEYVEQSFKHSCWSLMWFHLMTFNSELGMCALISKMIGLIHSFIWWNNWSSRITSLYWSTWKARRGGQPGWSGWLWILSLIHACTVYIYTVLIL